MILILLILLSIVVSCSDFIVSQDKEKPIDDIKYEKQLETIDPEIDGFWFANDIVINVRSYTYIMKNKDTTGGYLSIYHDENKYNYFTYNDTLELYKRDWSYKLVRGNN